VNCLRQTHASIDGVHRTQGATASAADGDVIVQADPTIVSAMSRKREPVG
jgi:hypothetical protein